MTFWFAALGWGARVNTYGINTSGESGVEKCYQWAPCKLRGAGELWQQKIFPPSLPWSSTAKYQGSGSQWGDTLMTSIKWHLIHTFCSMNWFTFHTWPLLRAELPHSYPLDKSPHFQLCVPIYSTWPVRRISTSHFDLICSAKLSWALQALQLLEWTPCKTKCSICWLTWIKTSTHEQSLWSKFIFSILWSLYCQAPTWRFLQLKYEIVVKFMTFHAQYNCENPQ